ARHGGRTTLPFPGLEIRLENFSRNRGHSDQAGEKHSTAKAREKARNPKAGRGLGSVFTLPNFASFRGSIEPPVHGIHVLKPGSFALPFEPASDSCFTMGEAVAGGIEKSGTDAVLFAGKLRPWAAVLLGGIMILIIG